MSDFDILHTALANKGFKHTIISDDNVEYYLPKATYLITSLLKTRSQVLDMTKEAVSLTKKTAEIIVVEYKGISWNGLKKVIK
jgi:hypothetical protein